MEKFLFFFTHYGIPTVFVLVVLLRRAKSLLGLWAAAGFFVSVLLFLFMWGQWPLVGSYYARLLPLAVIVLVALFAVRATSAGLPLLNSRVIFTVGSVILVACTGYVCYLVAGAYAGKHYPESFAELEFPLRDGRFYISSGGSRRIINNHMRDFPNAQEYALDINKLGAAGSASSNILLADNQLHHIFGEPVYAPCGGPVTEAVNDVADNAGSSMDVNPKNGSGNYVVIDCNGFVVALVHMKFGSARVSTGDNVKVGQQLGQVGNSGFSQEPHLHLQAATYSADGKLAGVPMRFAGRTYSRNDIVSNESGRFGH
jgi:hypothetical protein